MDSSPHNNFASDAEVMARIDAKDHSAMKALFDRYYSLLFAVACRILHDYGESEDLVQEVFSYIYGNARRYDCHRGSARSWLVQITTSRAINRRSYLKLRGFYVPATDGFSVCALSNCRFLAWEEAIDKQRNLEWLQAQISRFPLKQRQVFDLVLKEGYNLPEISEYLNESAANVRHYYYRGVEKLRNALIARVRGSSSLPAFSVHSQEQGSEIEVCRSTSGAILHTRAEKVLHHGRRLSFRPISLSASLENLQMTQETRTAANHG